MRGRLRRGVWTPRGRLILTLVFVVGGAVRLFLVLATEGVRPDIESYAFAGDALVSSGTRLYDELSRLPSFQPHWPYAPGFLPWVVAVRLIQPLTDLSFASLIKLPIAAADLAIAVAVVGYMSRRGLSERRRLVAAGLIALGPSFIVISGFHGQLDAVAVLPVVLAVRAWDSDNARRGVLAGLLVGLGAAIKTASIVTVLALLPTSRSRREAATLIGAAAVVPLVALLPFLIATPEATVSSLQYTDIPGFGGLSLVLQPSLAGWWRGEGTEPNALSAALSANQGVIVAIYLGVAAVVLLRRRTPPLEAAVLLWLGVYVFVPNFAFRYVVWGLPFLVMAGRLRQVAGLQLLLFAPALILYTTSPYLGPYVVLMIVVWLVFVLAFAGQAVRVLARPDGAAPATASASLSEAMQAHHASVERVMGTRDERDIKGLYVELGELLESAAGATDETPTLSFPENSPTVAGLLSGVSGRLLDAGCGPNPALSILLAHTPGRTIVGVDIGLAMVRLAKSRAHAAGVRMLAVVADLEALPFRTGAFDGAACDDTIEHVPSDASGTRELARVLAADGTLVLATPNRHRLDVLLQRLRDLGEATWRPASAYYVVRSHLREYSWRQLERLVRPSFTVGRRVTTGWEGELGGRFVDRVVRMGLFRRVGRMIVLVLRPRVPEE